ncbi:hypothetical protein [Bacillus sp. AFS017336]|uniref:hypothetical protein n=1 Tax=Bacillus sp. AFS017336 TaxID=2033489 RepID=UPI000BF21065|nr:hypothetical protein [Bacillus sp. AFS017336]PEL07792.1 hypothetical protein CN601_19060 [Bacillus sp. AFS017336]
MILLDNYITKEEVSEIAEQRTKKKDKNQRHIELVVQLCENFHIFRTPINDCYAKVKISKNGKTHYEIYDMETNDFKELIILECKDRFDEFVSNSAIETAVNYLKAQAKSEGRIEEVFIRIAEKNSCVYLDLANEYREVIEISKDGWKIINNPPVNFFRTNSTKSLPIPIKGGNVEELKNVLNYGNESNWKLTIGLLLSFFRRSEEYPIGNIQGEHGSAKSMFTTLLRSIVDPSVTALKTPPKDERDLAISVSKGYIQAYDNLSSITSSMSDILCRVATGGTYATRKLHSDKDEVNLPLLAPVLFNGITEVAKRQDLLSRLVIIHLPALTSTKDRKTILEEFEEMLPRVLGAILDVVSSGLNEMPNVVLEGNPRMASFGVWVTACEKALMWEKGSFMKAYNENISIAIDQGIDSDPVANAIFIFMEERNGWSGTPTELIRELEKIDEYDLANKNSKPDNTQLKNRLKRIKAALRKGNIQYEELKRTSKGSRLKLEKVIKKNDEHAL